MPLGGRAVLPLLPNIQINSFFACRSRARFRLGESDFASGAALREVKNSEGMQNAKPKKQSLERGLPQALRCWQAWLGA
jgi:hypothetical protein